MADECPVCAAKSLGAAKIRDCHLGKASPYQVALDLNCGYEQVMTHINDSHEIAVDQCGRMESQDVLLNKLMMNMNTIKEWTDYVVATVSGPRDIDRAKVQMLVQLTQETRKTIESIAELQGRKGPGDAELQVVMLNTRVVNLTNTIVDACCPECKMKILDMLDSREKLPVGGAHGVRKELSAFG